MTAKKKSHRQLNRSRTAFEVALLVISSVGIVTILVALTLYGVGVGQGPPELKVEATETGREAGGGREVTVVVSNGGSMTATDVLVEVTAGDTVREVTFRAVAKGDEEEATIVLSEDAPEITEAEIVSFREP